jgi:2-haloacid dehalogenase
MPSSVRYRWILFDADDTLFDFGRAEAGALAGAFERSGIAFDPAWLPVYTRINRGVWQDLELGRITPDALRTRRFELLFEALGLELAAEPFSAAYLAALARQPHLVDGAEAVVRALHGRHGIAVITNGLREVQRPRLERSAIADLVAHLIVSEEVGAAKPEAAIFDAAFRLMGDPGREEVLLVGDSLSSDIAGGNGYGIDTCWFNPAGRPRDGGPASTYEIRRLEELLALV